MKKSEGIKVTFTSRWDDGPTVVTPATYYPETGEVTAESVDIDPDGCLLHECITLPGGEELEVCDTCHSYVLKTVVTDRADLSYGETPECRNPECESHN